MELPEREYKVFEAILDGVPLDRLAVHLGISASYAQNLVSNLVSKLLKDMNTTFQVIVIREYYRRQTESLLSAFPAAPSVTDAEIDAKFSFYVRSNTLAKGATNAK